MRWNAVILMLAAAVATVAGCSQRCFITEKTLNEFHANNQVPIDAETNPRLAADPISGRMPAPADVRSPERKPRYITLAEAIALALENGSTGIQSVRQPGAINEDLQAAIPTGGFQLLNSDSVRVLSLNPAIAGLNIDAAISRFDAKWVTSVNFGVQDQPVQGFNSFSNGDNGRFASTLMQQLGTGGLAGITFSTQYQFLNNPPKNFPILNPAYTPRLGFTFEQPLWQGSGIEINQLLTRSVQLGTELNRAHPEASGYLNGHLINEQNQNASTAGGLVQTGILIARLRFDQSRADLERVINFTLLNTEIAYWNLYGAYVSLYSSEAALRQAYEAWKINKAKYESGTKPITDLAQSRGQYEQFRGDRLQALGRVLEAERILRALAGISPSDGTQLIPADQPSLTPYVPCWDVALEEALTLRPELIAARHELKTLQFDIMVQKNFLKPDLRFLSSYGVDALGTQLDGNGQILDQSVGRFKSNNAFRILSSMHYDDWDIGLLYNVPLGFRFEHAAVRRARLALAQGFLAVKREEDKAVRFLTKAYRDVFESYDLIESRRAQRQAFAEQVAARFKEFLAGKTTTDFLLEAQRQWANALSTEYQAIVAYQNALASFEFAKGTIMQHDTVALSEGPLPQCVAVRAIEHERERSKAITLLERAHPVPYPGPSAEHGDPGLPTLSPIEAPSLPALLEGAPKLPGRLEDAPPPRTTPPAAAPKPLRIDTLPPAAWQPAPAPQTVPSVKREDSPALQKVEAPAKETVLQYSAKKENAPAQPKVEEAPPKDRVYYYARTPQAPAPRDLPLPAQGKAGNGPAATVPAVGTLPVPDLAVPSPTTLPTLPLPAPGGNLPTPTVR